MDNSLVRSGFGKILGNFNEASAATGLRRINLNKIADAAGAVVWIGNRKYYNMELLKKYIDSISGRSDEGSSK